MAEGYGADTLTVFGPSGRKLKLKSGIVVRRSGIAGYYTPGLMELVEDFRTFVLVGFPRANWCECPNRTVQTVLTLKPLYDFYMRKRGE